MVAQEQFIACCRCREAIEPFRFLLSLHSQIGPYNNVQNWTFMTAKEHFLAYYRCRKAVNLFK
jgi:hypothetical protein